MMLLSCSSERVLSRWTGSDSKGLCELTSELGGDGLDLCILLQPVFAQFTSDSRLFITTKWRSNVDDVVAIHPDRASSNTIRNRKRLFDVASPYSRRES